MRHMIMSFGRVLAVTGVLAIGSAFAQEPAATPVKLNNPGLSSQVPSQQVALPACLEKLNLAPEQQAQLQEIVRDYDADVASVWKQFSDRYLETLKTEAILLSAIEDNLTEPQRQQVRDQRRRVAQHEKAIAGANVKAKQETVKPVSAVEKELDIVGVSLTSRTGGGSRCDPGKVPQPPTLVESRCSGPSQSTGVVGSGQDRGDRKGSYERSVEATA